MSDVPMTSLRAGAVPLFVRKLAAAALLITVFSVVLIAVNLIHFRFFTVNVVFYSSVMDALMAVAITMAGYAALMGTRVLSAFEQILMGGICLLGGYAFAISGPAVVDRSLSIYILEKLAQRGGAIQQSAMEDVFIKEYVPEHRLVDVRLTEQLYSGTITIEDGCVRLTEWGETIASISRTYRTTFLPKHRILMGEASDDLTDPFRNSVPAGDYACE